MPREIFSNTTQIAVKLAVTNIILIANAFTWYSYAFAILKEIVEGIGLTHFEILVIWVIHFSGAAFSAIIGAFLSNKFKQRKTFLLFWILLGIFSSFALLLAYTVTLIGASVVSLLVGVSFGLGMPACMGYYKDCTVLENRARLGGITYFAICLGFFLLETIAVPNITVKIMILSVWRGLGLFLFLLLKPPEKFIERRATISYVSILRERSFFLYLIPWCMFCLVNYTSAPVVINFFKEDFVRFSMAIEGAFSGVSSIMGGFFSDIFGRKRIIIAGFVMLGLGYAVLGIYPGSLLGWYFYTIVDGIAWGIFYTLFILALWGDIARDAPGDKYYALGGLPFLLSKLLQLIMGPYLTEVVSVYTIFSLASFFLFLAVLPLMYAPETLPEKKIRERELKQYIEKAKKIKKKYT